MSPELCLHSCQRDHVAARRGRTERRSETSVRKESQRRQTLEEDWLIELEAFWTCRKDSGDEGGRVESCGDWFSCVTLSSPGPAAQFMEGTASGILAGPEVRTRLMSHCSKAH